MTLDDETMNRHSANMISSQKGNKTKHAPILDPYTHQEKTPKAIGKKEEFLERTMVRKGSHSHGRIALATANMRQYELKLKTALNKVWWIVQHENHGSHK